MTNEITKEQIDENWELINGQVMPRPFEASQLSQQQLNDISIFEKDSHGKYKYKKRKHEKNKIKVGDVVFYNGVQAKVVDIDDNLLCVRDLETGNLCVWDTNKASVKRY